MARKQGVTNTPETRLRHGAQLRSCETCGAEFWVPRWQLEKYLTAGRFCSRPCKYESMRGQAFYRPPNKGKVIQRGDGYLSEWAPGHPRAHDGRVLQHILVMEQTLGRSLRSDEEVHHVNHVRNDNRPENLQVARTGEHQRMHNSEPARREAMRQSARLRAQPRDPQTGRFTPVTITHGLKAHR